MQYTDEQAAALTKLETAFKNRLSPASNQAAENSYGNAYQACVKLLCKPQIKRRYRVGR